MFSQRYKLFFESQIFHEKAPQLGLKCLIICQNIITSVGAKVQTISNLSITRLQGDSELLGELGNLISLSNLLATLDTLRQRLIEYALKILLQGIHIVAGQREVSRLRTIEMTISRQTL